MQPLLKNPLGKIKDATFTVVMRGKTIGRSVRANRWRYTEWEGGALGVELYDHQSHAGEYRNLVREAKHAATVTELKKLLQRTE
ncbi:MAG: hypothetical protein ACKVZH_24010 [Blastocatellia bacterium]